MKTIETSTILRIFQTIRLFFPDAISFRIQHPQELHEKMLQAADTIEKDGLAVLLLPVELVNALFNIRKPHTKGSGSLTL